MLSSLKKVSSIDDQWQINQAFFGTVFKKNDKK